MNIRNDREYTIEDFKKTQKDNPLFVNKNDVL